MSKRTTAIVTVFIALLVAPVISLAAVWYSGREYTGYEIDCEFHYDVTAECPVTKESPAEKYESFGGSLAAQLEDKVDHVEVTVQGLERRDTYVYFRTEAACEKFCTRLYKQEKREEKQEQEKLAPYR